MPVTKSAKKALAVSHRRHAENLKIKEGYKKAIKSVRKAVSNGEDTVAAMTSSAQSLLDRAAKSKTIHKNKAARLKSRLAKLVQSAGSETVQAAKKTVKKATKTVKKTAAKKK